ncbi:MAG: F0F1 ATP synthase subunit B [Treponema sp.]|jgi:F-type H+-transporting ATPase subunit b|nr:F0F1 ATP synthase subunit B [Treponema sp.]
MLDFSVTFIITIVNIAILFFILRKLLFKPVTKFMAERAKRLQDSMDPAERERERAEALLSEYKRKLDSAGDEADEILRNAREEAAREARRIIQDGKAEAAGVIAAARGQLEAERQAALTKFKSETAALVMAAASKVITRDLTGDDDRRYVNMLLDELAAQKGII